MFGTGGNGGGLDLFGGGTPTSKEFGRSEAHANLYGDTINTGLGNTALLILSAAGVLVGIVMLVLVLHRK